MRKRAPTLVQTITSSSMDERPQNGIAQHVAPVTRAGNSDITNVMAAIQMMM